MDSNAAQLSHCWPPPTHAILARDGKVGVFLALSLQDIERAAQEGGNAAMRPVRIRRVGNAEAREAWGEAREVCERIAQRPVAVSPADDMQALERREARTRRMLPIDLRDVPGRSRCRCRSRAVRL